MKVKTNLTPDELNQVASALHKLAKARKPEELGFEAELLHKLEKVLEIYTEGLKKEFQEVLHE